MINTLYAEFRKLLSIRSTYGWSLAAILFSGIFSFWGTGYRGGPNYAVTTLQETSLTSILIMGFFVGIVSIFVICHEYRYNTISYTLTASNNRLKVLLSKLIVTGVYAIVMAMIGILAGMGLTMLGAKLAGSGLGPQDVDFYAILWRSMAYLIGGAWIGLLVGFLVRSQVFAIVVFFLVPTLEQLIHGLFKVNADYLPFAARNEILALTSAVGTNSAIAATGVVAMYVAILGIAAAIIFRWRDAQ